MPASIRVYEGDVLEGMGVSFEPNKFATARAQGLDKDHASNNVSGTVDERMSAVYAKMAEQRQAADRAKALERARFSEPREFTEADGTVWGYVTIDDAEVKITSCTTQRTDLEFPREIEGKPVVALAVDSCAELDVESIVCHEQIQSIESRAFRSCKNLKKLVLPAQLATFEASWYARCEVLETLVLPGMLAKMDGTVFDAPLKHLTLGAGLSEIEPGAFAKSQLESIEVDEASPFLRTDGLALIEVPTKTLLALAIPQQSYTVEDGIEHLARKAFSTFPGLEEVILPDSVVSIEGFAYARTSVSSFTAPASLEEIGEKAFFHCDKLAEVIINEGFRILGDEAFCATPLEQLHLPASTEAVGVPGDRTKLTFRGVDAGFSIAEGADLFMDASGGLYRRGPEGLVFVRLLDADVESYEVLDGTIELGEACCDHHRKLAEVTIPDGVTVIRSCAFRDCKKLTVAHVPDSVETFEERAFFDSGLEEIHIPAKLANLGDNALVTWGAHRDLGKPSLSRIDVSPKNKRYLMEGGMLCERWESGKGRIIVFTGTEEVVRFPDWVIAVAAYAFNGARGIRELWISERVASVGIRGLAVSCYIELIHVDLKEPVMGHDYLDIRFPDIDRSVQQISLAFSSSDRVDPKLIYKHHDTLLARSSGYDALQGNGLDLYEQAMRIVGRLKDPVYFEYNTKTLCESFMRENLLDVCVAVARHDDRATMEALFDLGFIMRDNVVEVIDAVGKVEDAAMTSFLLELKRTRLGDASFDFEL